MMKTAPEMRTTHEMEIPQKKTPKGKIIVMVLNKQFKSFFASEDILVFNICWTENKHKIYA